MSIQTIPEHYSMPATIEIACGQKIDTNLFLPKSWMDRYGELENTIRVLDLEYNDYNRTVQGGCTDGKYIYRLLIGSSSDLSVIQKLDFNGTVLLEKYNYCYGHGNDITYCSKDGYLYVCNNAEKSKIHKVDRRTLEHVETFEIKTNAWGIAYNETFDIWVIGVSGSYYFSIFNNEWEFMFRLKSDNIPSGYIKQSICCDKDYIYATYDRVVGASEDDNSGGIVQVFTWNGYFVKQYAIYDKEVEFCAILPYEDDPFRKYIYISIYEGKDENDQRRNSLIRGEFDLYPGQTSATGRPTDNCGSIANLERLHDGTHVQLWKGNAQSGTIKLWTGAMGLSCFRYYKVYAYGGNSQVKDWYKAGALTMQEINPYDDVDTHGLNVRELAMTYDDTTKSFTITNNTCHNIKFNDDGTFSSTKTAYPTATSQSYLEVRQIWGIV